MLDPRYLKGIQNFNAEEFYDAHETWENLWHELKGEEADFLQALIQLATALHHFRSGNLKGAKILYEEGMKRLATFPSVYWNLPVQKLKDDMTDCVKKIVSYELAELPGRYAPDKAVFPVRLEKTKIPKIVLQKEGDRVR